MPTRVFVDSGFAPEPAGAPLRRWIPRILFFAFAILILTPLGVIQLLSKGGSVLLSVACLSWPLVYVGWRLLLRRIDRGCERVADAEGAHDG